MKYVFFILIIFYPAFSYSYAYKLDTIIIDPGHGGKDPGAIDKKTKLMEKNINLKIALFLKDLLNKNLTYMKTYFTRETDNFISLGGRSKLANKYSKKKAFFISIHTNSHNSRKKVEGVEVFYHYTSNSTIANFRLQEIKTNLTKSENVHFQTSISHIVNSKLKEDSKLLAGYIAKGLKIASDEPLRRVGASNLYVTSYNTIPAVLVEVGFIDSRKFLNARYQKKIAKGIFLGILRYIKAEKYQ